MKMSKMICNNNNDKKAEGDEGKEMVRKGPWTRAEDEMLREYVRNHGDRNWSSVVKKTGLTRSGKSCRLRWTNHLRPDLKKTAFCKQEEQIIVYLHSQIGNKWARMAAQLPGRTDNEIKNFWNTRIKRCQREGLPIYPQPQELETFKLLLQQNQFSAQAHPSSSSLPFSSSLYPSHYHQEQPRFEVPNENCGNGDKVVLPLSPAVVSIYGSSSSSETNNNDSHDYHFGSYNYGFNNNVEMVGDKSLPLVQCMNAGVSSQSPPPPHGSINSANNSSYASEVHGCVGASSSSMANNNNGYHEVAPLSPHGNNNGLLNDITMAEAQNLFLNDNIESEGSTRAEELSKVSTGKKVAAENTIIMEGMNLMDDDLFGVLNNFCFEMPVPEWYHKGGTNQPLGSD